MRRAAGAAPALVATVAAAFCLLAAAPLAGAEAQPAGAGSSGQIRGDRYCEVLPVYRDGLRLKVVVYNTIGHGDCPPALWQALDADAVATELDALRVILNGPRFWLMDEIIGRGRSAAGEVRSIGGMTMAPRASISLPLYFLLFGADPYQARTIDRDTVFVYRAGTPVFELTDPDGHVHVMQTFSRTRDPALSMDDLPGLSSRLDLPRGWTFATRVLDRELRLEAGGAAVVVQDDLENTYQRR